MKPTEKRKLFLLLKVKEFVNDQGNIFLQSQTQHMNRKRL